MTKRPDPIGDILKRNGIGTDPKELGNAINSAEETKSAVEQFVKENKSAEEKAAEDGDVMIGATGAGAQRKLDLGDVLNHLKSSGMDGIKKIIDQFGSGSSVDKEALEAKIANAVMPADYPKGPSDEDIDRIKDLVDNGKYPKIEPKTEGGPLNMPKSNEFIPSPATKINPCAPFGNSSHTIPDLAVRDFGQTFGAGIGFKLTNGTIHCNVIDAGSVSFKNCNVIVNTIDSTKVKIKDSTLSGSPKVYTRSRGMRLTDCILKVDDLKSDMTNDERLDIYSARLSRAFDVDKDLIHSYLTTVSDWIDANVIVIPSQTCSVEGLAFEYGRSGSVKIDNETLLKYCITCLLTKFNPYQDYVTAQNVYLEGKWVVLLKGCILDGTKVKDALRAEEEVKRQSKKKPGIDLGGLAGMFGAMGGMGGMGMPSIPTPPPQPVDVPNQAGPTEPSKVDIVRRYLRTYYRPVTEGSGYSDTESMVQDLMRLNHDTFNSDEALDLIRQVVEEGGIYGDGYRQVTMSSVEGHSVGDNVVWVHSNEHIGDNVYADTKARVMNWINKTSAVETAEGFGFPIRDLYDDFTKTAELDVPYPEFCETMWDLLTINRVFDTRSVKVLVTGGSEPDPAIDAFYENVVIRKPKSDDSSESGESDDGESHTESSENDNFDASLRDFLTTHIRFMPDCSTATVDLQKAYANEHPGEFLNKRALSSVIESTITAMAEAAGVVVTKSKVPSISGGLRNGFVGVKYLEQKPMQPIIGDDGVNHEPWDENFESLTGDEVFDWCGAFLRNACFHEPNSCITLPALKKFFIQWMGLPEDFRYNDDAEDSKDLIADSLMTSIATYQWIDGVTFHPKHGGHKNVFVDIGCIFAKHTNPRDCGIVSDEPMPDRANLVDAIRDFIYRNCIPNAENHISVTDLWEQFIDTLPKSSQWLDVGEETFLKAVSVVFNGTGRFGSTKPGTYTGFDDEGSITSQYTGFSNLSYRPSIGFFSTYDRGLNQNDTVFDYVSRFLQFFYMPDEDARPHSTEHMFDVFCDYSNIEISYPSFAAMVGRALNGLRAGDGTIGASGRNWNIVEATDMQQDCVDDVEYPGTFLNCSSRDPVLEDISVEKHAAE